jgi:hypothetical protein
VAFSALVVIRHKKRTRRYGEDIVGRSNEVVPDGTNVFYAVGPDDVMEYFYQGSAFGGILLASLIVIPVRGVIDSEDVNSLSQWSARVVKNVDAVCNKGFLKILERQDFDFEGLSNI